MIFDLDGVLTNTASAHFKAWKETFDEFLRGYEPENHELFTEDDYNTYVDGKPRYEGVNSFLSSRKIKLPWGREDDSPGRRTVIGVGNRKNQRYRELIAHGEIEVISSSIDFVNALRAKHVKTAMVSSSRNAREVLHRAGLEHLFDTCVDGEIVVREGMAGKPAPDMFLEAARRLSVSPRRAIVVEDAVAGVEAAKAGGFLCVVGLSESRVKRSELKRIGADIVVASLDELEWCW